MGLSNSGEHHPIVNVRASGKYAFVELRLAEDAANMLNLDNVPFLGQLLKIVRPSKLENPPHAPMYMKWEQLPLKWNSDELKMMSAGPVSRVLRLTNMVSDRDLTDPSLLEEVVEDTRQQCAHFGRVHSVIIPSPSATFASVAVAGVGNVFVAMSNELEAVRCLVNMKGRAFDGRIVDVKFYPDGIFFNQDYSWEPPPFVLSAAGPVTLESVLPRHLL